MNMEEFLQEKAKEINLALEAFLPKKPSNEWLDFVAGKPEHCYDAKTIEASINKPLWDFLSRGGKRWRPALMLLSCSAVGGNPDEIKEFVVLPELTHNGTIIVDDVEDNSLMRRGKPTLHRIYGTDIAVNAGNSLYFLPLKLIDKFRQKQGAAFDAKALKIYSVYSEEMVRLSFGQAMDIYWHRGNVKSISEGQYLQMCIYKTGSLARLSAKLGAILGNGSESQVTALGNFAASIGVGFQIQDDILNLSPSKKWGKELGDDISEGKRSLLVVHALGNSPGAKAKKLLSILDSHTKDKKKVKEAIAIIGESGAVVYAKEKAKSIVAASWEKLDKEITESDSKAKLRAFADYMIEREI